MSPMTRLRTHARRAVALTAAGMAAGCVAGVSTASATVPAPPPGAPAVESAPSSLTGTSPQLPQGVIASSAAPGSHWRPERAVYGTGSRNDIAIAGAGGTTIRVNEIYPTTASGKPARGHFPVVLTMTPYGKGQGGSSKPGSAQSATGGAATGGADDYLVQRGYINVVEDVRGTGDSNGSWGLFDPIQQQDAIHVLHWAAKLPDSDGRVGTYGPSYLGIDQLLLAGAVGRHSPLKAIFPMVPANDIYRDTSFMGGLIDFEFDEIYLGLTGALNSANPVGDTASDPTLLADLASIETDHANGLASYHAATTANVLGGGDEDYDGTYWQARNPENVLARIAANHIPAYMVGGEYDIFQNGEPLDYAELQNAWAGRGTSAPMAAGQRTTGRYQLIVGPWEHINGSSVNVDPLELEWFDTWLKGERTGMGSTPTPLHYYDLGSGRFDETSTYPFARSAPTRLYFGSGKTLTASAPSASVTGAARRSQALPGVHLPGLPLAGLPRAGLPGAGSLTGPLATDTIAWSPVGSPCGRPIDQWAMGGISIPAHSAGLLAPCADDDALTQLGPSAISYTSTPLTRAATIAGPVTVTVYASATTAQTQLVAELEQVTPNGTSYPLTEGALLGSLRAVDAHRSWTQDGTTVLPYHPYTQSSTQPVTPGAMTEYQIQVFPTLDTIAAGDRIRLTLSTADTPHLTPQPAQLAQLAGGVYTIGRSATAPSSVTLDVIR